jgi:YHS domain-containing protein
MRKLGIGWVLLGAVLAGGTAASAACAKKEPAATATGAESGATATATDTWYVCPMTEDNYWQKGPGQCPKCGMNLVPAPAGWTPPGTPPAPTPPAAAPPAAAPAPVPAATPPAPTAAAPASRTGTAKDLAPDRIGQEATCPVTGDHFVVADNTPAVEYGGQTYLFCCAACPPRFLADPQRYGAPPAGGS